MFSGTQQKCKVCTKTVYPMDQLSTDGVVFHRSCFKCHHCKSTLSTSVERSCPMEEINVVRPPNTSLYTLVAEQ